MKHHISQVSGQYLGLKFLEDSFHVVEAEVHGLAEWQPFEILMFVRQFDRVLGKCY